MTEPAMQIDVGLSLDAVDRDFKALSNKVNAVPRKVTVGIEVVDADAAVSKINRVADARESATVQLQRQREKIMQMQREEMRAIEMYNRALQMQAIGVQSQIAANDNYARSHMGVTGALKSTTQAGLESGASYLATTAKMATAAVAVGALATVLGTLYIGYRIIKTGVDLVTDAWALGNARIAEYVAIGQKASIVSTDFAQRLAKAAPGVDLLTDAVKRLNDASAAKLGGSDLQNRLSALTEAGNFTGNTGVDQLKMATDAEAKFRAMAALIDQAMQKGERLAALDLSAKFLGPQVTEALTKNNDYLNQMLTNADRIAKTELVSPEDIGRAAELTSRYDAATKILSERWHPLQEVLTSLGWTMKSIWVGIVETIANGVDAVGRFIGKLLSFPYWDKLKDALSMYHTGYKQPEGPANVDRYAYATNQLRAGLQTAVPGQTSVAVRQAMDNTQTMSWALRPDTSKAPGSNNGAKAINDTNDAVDRAINTLQRHIEQQKADTLAVGLGEGALARFRAEAAETAARLANNGKETDEQRLRFAKLKEEAFATADALARTNVASNIDWNKKTTFLSQEDVAIAAQLRGIYGNDIPAALASMEAAQIRVNNAQRLMVDGFRETGKAVFSAFLSGKNMMDAMVQSLDNVAKKLADSAFDNILGGLVSGNLLQAGIGVAQAGASAAISAFTGQTKEKKALEEAQAAWKNMAGQVLAFNAAAAGMNLGPLTNELNSLYSTTKQLQEAAFKAKDRAGEAAAARAFNNAVERIWETFKTGSQVLTPLQEQMKALNDEASGLKDALNLIGFTGREGTIDSIVQERMEALKSQFKTTFIDGLTKDINASRGLSYLNDITDAVSALTKDLADAAALGGGALTDLANDRFKAKAQSIVDGAELAGDAFTGLTSKFPQLQSVVHEFTVSAVVDAQKLRDAQNAAAKSVTDYLANLQGGSGSTQSPLATLASAKTLYESNLAIAQQGNADAQGKWASLADNYERALRSVFASGEGYQTGKNQIINQGLGLPAVQATTDPVVAELRNTIAAIQIGNAALAAANSLTSNSVLPAVNAGNASAIAASLQTYFNQIDPSGKLNTVVTNTLGAWQNTGNLSYLDPINNKLITNNTLTGTTNSLTDAGNLTLDAIKGLQTTATSQLILLQNALAATFSAAQYLIYETPGSTGSGNANSTQPLQNQMVQALNKIVWNTYATAQNTSWASGLANEHHVYGTYARGGLITGPGTGTSDSLLIRASNREYMMQNSVVEKFGVGFFDQLNRGIMPAVFNDNRPINMPAPVLPRGGGESSSIAALIEEVKDLKREVQKLREENTQITIATANQTTRVVAACGEEMSDTFEKAGRRVADELRVHRFDQRGRR